VVVELLPEVAVVPDVVVAVVPEVEVAVVAVVAEVSVIVPPGMAEVLVPAEVSVIVDAPVSVIVAPVSVMVTDVSLLMLSSFLHETAKSTRARTARIAKVFFITHSSLICDVLRKFCRSCLGACPHLLRVLFDA
jgi:hypothetical protein